MPFDGCHLVWESHLLTLEDFVDDKPWTPAGPEFEALHIDNQIDGVELRRLEAQGRRGGAIWWC